MLPLSNNSQRHSQGTCESAPQGWGDSSKMQMTLGSNQFAPDSQTWQLQTWHEPAFPSQGLWIYSELHPGMATAICSWLQIPCEDYARL